MDFLSFDIVVSDNIVSDYPVLRGEIFAKLSFQETLKLARCYLSLLQTGPRSYFLKLVSSCYFFPRTDDGRICWKFQIPPGKGKTIAMFVLFKFQTYSIFCLTKFPRNIYIQKRAEPPESEKPNGPSIEGERGKVQNLNSMKWLLDRAALARPGNDEKEETLASDRLGAAPTRAREEEGCVCLRELWDDFYLHLNRDGLRKGLGGSEVIQVRWCRVSRGRLNGQGAWSRCCSAPTFFLTAN